MELSNGALAALVVGFPVGLVGFLAVLGWLEAWMVEPDERAALVQLLLAEEREVEELERVVADLMARVSREHQLKGFTRSPVVESADRDLRDSPVQSGVS